MAEAMELDKVLKAQMEQRGKAAELKGEDDGSEGFLQGLKTRERSLATSLQAALSGEDPDALTPRGKLGQQFLAAVRKTERPTRPYPLAVGPAMRHSLGEAAQLELRNRSPSGAQDPCNSAHRPSKAKMMPSSSFMRES